MADCAGKMHHGNSTIAKGVFTSLGKPEVSSGEVVLTSFL